jgi:hypothetical protein
LLGSDNTLDSITTAAQIARCRSPDSRFDPTSRRDEEVDGGRFAPKAPMFLGFLLGIWPHAPSTGDLKRPAMVEGDARSRVSLIQTLPTNTPRDAWKAAGSRLAERHRWATVFKCRTENCQGLEQLHAILKLKRAEAGSTDAANCASRDPHSDRPTHLVTDWLLWQAALRTWSKSSSVRPRVQTLSNSVPTGDHLIRGFACAPETNLTERSKSDYPLLAAGGHVTQPRRFDPYSKESM